jgi:hypothetical protein
MIIDSECRAVETRASKGMDGQVPSRGIYPAAWPSRGSMPSAKILNFAAGGLFSPDIVNVAWKSLSD